MIHASRSSAAVLLSRRALVASTKRSTCLSSFSASALHGGQNGNSKRSISTNNLSIPNTRTLHVSSPAATSAHITNAPDLPFGSDKVCRALQTVIEQVECRQSAKLTYSIVPFESTGVRLYLRTQ